MNNWFDEKTFFPNRESKVCQGDRMERIEVREKPDRRKTSLDSYFIYHFTTLELLNDIVVI